jgi:hypothetical protein
LHEKKLFVELTSAAARSDIFMQRNEIMQRINDKAGGQVVEEIILK